MIAEKYFGGHYTIYKFTTGYKGCYGTLNDDVRDELNALPNFDTLLEVLCWLNKTTTINKFL